MIYFQINKNKDHIAQPYWWVIRSSGNHATLATSEMYTRKRDVLHAIDLIRGNITNATIIDNTEESDD